MRCPFGNISREKRLRASLCLCVVLLAFCVRFLTAQFIGQPIADPAWFSYEIYAFFDNQAQDILDGKVKPFWIGDALLSPRAATAAVLQTPDSKL